MSVSAVTPAGPKPYSDAPVIVGPVQTDFASQFGAAVAGAPLGRSAASSTSTGSAVGNGFGSSTTATGRELMPLGQMIGADSMSGAMSALGVASITRPTTFAPTGVAVTSSSKSSTHIPDVLRSYGNGRIPSEMLTPIGINSHKLYAPAAQAFIAMRSAAAADGVDIGVTDSYRSYDQQVELANRKGLYKNGGLAAVPGTSQHGWGMALDVDVDSAGLAWLRQHGAEYGYVEAVPREPWHWEFHGAT